MPVLDPVFEVKVAWSHGADPSGIAPLNTVLRSIVVVIGVGVTIAWAGRMITTLRLSRKTRVIFFIVISSVDDP